VAPVTDIAIAADQYKAKRLRWRVKVLTAAATSADRTAGRMAWHLADCQGDEAAHCPQGRASLAAGGDPDGHCLVEGACPRCAAAESAAP
jgi:hypothetical protein